MQPLIYCAIDTKDLSEACNLARILSDITGIKLGLEFFNAHGPQGVEAVLRAAPDAALFLDLKFHDIPNTVAGAVSAICDRFAPAYLNVHAAGGSEMMQAARAACAPGTKLLAVTVLTSLSQPDLKAIGFKRDAAAETVEDLARLSLQAGLDGVVCSAHEIALLRKACGPDYVLMVPGIRPAGAAAGDQKRVMTPPEAVACGASHLVIGRPITQAPDPVAAVQAILADLIA